MPLLNKKPFQKNTIPSGLKDNDKVFYCDVTNEVFDNYQEFAERIILCNSLVWACEETGKSGLTYSEAVECEKNAKKLLHKFPIELRRLILYLVTLTNRSALSDLTDEIFYFVRERFFIGECVEYNIQGDQWIRCRIQKVVAPTAKDLSEAKNGLKPSDKLFWPPGSSYHYDIELPSKPDGVKQATNVSPAKLRRKKSTYTRDRNHLFIKHFVSKVDGQWQLKPNVVKRYDVHRVKFEDFFIGQPPKFPKSESPKKPAAKKSLVSSPSVTPKSGNKSATTTGKAKKQESIDKYLKPKVMDGSSPGKRGGASASASNSSDSKSKKLNNSNSNTKKAAEKRKSTEEILERELLEKRRKMMEHQQQLIEKKQQKQLDIQRKKDEKKKLEEFVKEWSKTREDLELEDLRELPNPIPIHLNTPNEYFGEIVMLYEFFQSFCQEVNTKNFFPAGITIELIDRAISQPELAGPLCDFVHLLLVAIFKLQEEEEDEMGEPYDLFAVTNFDTLALADAQPSSNDVPEAAINWPIAFHGVPLPKLPVDATTISEILRLHLLSAGGRVSEQCSRWRAQEKGGFTANDDPAVTFRHENEHIIRLLSESSIGTLSHKDKIAVLECLANQIVMYMGLRNIIHDSVETYRQKRVELRVALAAEIRKEKELMLQKKKKPVPGAGDATKQAEESSAAAADQAPVNLEAIEKACKEVQRKKDDLQRQLDELMSENMKVQHAPLGMDRAYRRFWVFPSLPGVFVEDGEQYLPPCLPRGTPALNAALLKEKEPLSYVKKLFQKEYNKENLGTWLSFGSPKKATNGGEAAKSEETSRAPLTCWGDNDACPVHARRSSEVCWSYYRTESELDALLNSLNTRGKRESRLKALLTQHREMIVKNLSKQRINLNKTVPLEGDEKEGGSMIETRKSSRGNPTYEDAMFNYAAETSVEEVLEALLRNTIINIEERSNIGGLGHLKVLNREAWIEAIKNNTYEKSCDKLVWGPKDEPEEEAIAEKDPKLVPKPKVYTNLEKFEALNKYVDDVKQNVKDIACALLQLEQSIEAHYLKPPLGAERTRHHPSKASTTDLLKRWEASLMKCSSFAQLFIHVNTLENSIAWSRSAQNAHCRICRRRGDAQNMLLCDSCNKGHHMYCLKPKLTKVPKGDWFCHACKPPVREPRETRERKKVNYAGDSDEEFFDRKSIMCLEKMEPKDKGKCKVCNERGNTIGCSKCQKRYHLNCLLPPLRKPPTMSWACHSCRQISARKDEESAYMVNGHRRRTRHSLESDYSTQLPLDNATLQELLTKIMHHEDAWPFLKPVSRYEAADYFQIVKRPMDFAKIRHKLNMLEYHMNNQVIKDSMLVFQNCFLYNKETSEIYQAGVRLLEYFKELCHELNFKKEFLECESQLGKPSTAAATPSLTNGQLEIGDEEAAKMQDDEEGDEQDDDDDDDEMDEEDEVVNDAEEADIRELIEVLEDEEDIVENADNVELDEDEDEEADSADDMENLNISGDSSSDEYNPKKKMRTS